MTSPFFRPTPTLESQIRIPSNDASTSGMSTEDDERPVTPSPASVASHPATSASDDATLANAHRIPSFEFEEIKLTSEEMLVRRATIQKNPYSPTKPVSTSTSASSSGFTNPYYSQDNVRAIADGDNKGSVRIRQRISREMIRETIDRKYAEGSISRRPHSALGIGGSSNYSSMGSEDPLSASGSGSGSGFGSSAEMKRASTPGTGYSTSVAPPTLSASSSNASTRNKALPPPPGVSSTPMLKSATEVPRSNVVPPPLHRPRSYTHAPAAAEELIRQSSEMGAEPSSGLDRIIAGGQHAAPIQGLPQRGSSYGPTAVVGRPVSILQNPHPYIPPAPSSATTGRPTPRTPSRSETAPVRAPSSSGGMMASSSSSSTADFGLGASGSRGRDVSGLSAIHEGGSKSSRKSRRSMSMSDANEVIMVSSSRAVW